MIDVFIEQLEFYAYHGVPDCEQQTGHRYSVDLTLRVESLAEETDQVADTADYAKIASDLVQFGENQQYRTLERLAAEMGQRVLKQNARVESIKITIRKLLPPAPIIARATGVTLEVRR